MMIGCGPDVTNINDDEPYNKFIGKKFIITSKSLIIEVSGKRILVCLNDRTARFYLKIPYNLSNDMIGRYINDIKIIGILDKNSIFSIKNAINIKTFEDSNNTFEIKIDGINGEEFGLLDSSWITHSDRNDPSLPKFKGNCIQPLDKSMEKYIWWPKAR